MTTPRYSLKAALAACRGALTTVRRARRRYAKSHADLQLDLAECLLVAAERRLRLAVVYALNERASAIARPVKRRKAA